VAVVNNYTGEMSSTDPNTATVWQLSIRDDVYWHEGYGYTMAADAAELKCTVDDIIFFYSICIDDDGPPNTSRGTYQLIFGTDPAKSFVKVDDYTMQFHLNSINADLLSWIGSSGMPRHVLDPTYDAGYGVGVRKDGTTAPGYTDWKTDDFNQGLRTAGDTTHAATIGNGPYVLYPGEDPVQQTVTLTKNTNYFKDSDPTWQSIVEDRPDKYIYTWISNKDAAEIALEAGDIDIMDKEFSPERLPSDEKQTGYCSRQTARIRIPDDGLQHPQRGRRKIVQPMGPIGYLPHDSPTGHRRLPPRRSRTTLLLPLRPTEPVLAWTRPSRSRSV
jgi:ABC-type transport system substrate-binding protein